MLEATGLTEETQVPEGTSSLDRRRFMAWFTAAGLGTTALPSYLWSQARKGPITKSVIAAAEKVAGLEFDEEERELMLRGLNQNLETYEALRSVDIPNEVSPALNFDPVLPGRSIPASGPSIVFRRGPVRRPVSDSELAFLPVTALSELIRTRQVSSTELTELYLGRLKEHDGVLKCVITLTEERARRLAKRADDELARGIYRGPLHGIPWGAKDLLSARGYRTTWGAKPFEDQVIDEDAAVVRKLDEAGAVLVAKLTLGALAWGDVWFGGRTRNPWKTDQGSSGSSAGPASATVAGLVGFSVGSETLGSIVSPSTRCGATGLRPTFGRVSRAGAMALSWTMDKLGPICRSVEDCALVLDAIKGTDGKDPTVHDAAFNWDSRADIGKLRVGYLKAGFERDHRGKEFDDRALEVMRGLGMELIPVELPGEFPLNAMSVILSVEAAAAFDQLTRSGKDALLVRQIRNAWPNVFRQSRLVPAVEYIQANRLRTMYMGAMERALSGVDAFITPTFAPGVVLATNLTGHPAVVVPNGFRDDGTPVSISFIGKLFGEADALAVAKAYQDATGFHEKHPPAFV